MEQGHSVSLHKIWREAFNSRGEKNCFVQIYWGTVLHGGLMIRSWEWQGSFTNAFSSNLKTVNPEIFVNHEGIYA